MLEENINTSEVKWSENVIIADADYVGNVAFDLIVNFERMIGRSFPRQTSANGLCAWLLTEG